MSQEPADRFDERLRHVLANDTPVEPCPDSEVLAAHADGSLDAAARRACEEHLASCPRCQAIMSLVSGATDEEADAAAQHTPAAGGMRVVAPPPVPVPGPANVEVEPGPEPFATRGPAGNAQTSAARRRGVVLPFGWKRIVTVAGPIALAASVLLAVWIARPSHDVPAVARVEAPAEAEQSVAHAPEVLRQVPEAPADASASDAALQGRAAPRAAPATPPALPARSNDALDTLATAPMRDAAPAPAAPATSAMAPKAAAPDAAAGAARERAPAEFAPVGQAAADEKRENAGRREMAAAGAATFSSPSGETIWRLAGNGLIVRTRGAATDTQRVGDDLQAGAALSDAVAWAVGRGGAVWRTTDGAMWIRVPNATNEDLTAVTVASADAATIRTRSGRQFATVTAGRQWTLIPD